MPKSEGTIALTVVVCRMDFPSSEGGIEWEAARPPPVIALVVDRSARRMLSGIAHVDFRGSTAGGVLPHTEPVSC